MDFLSNGRLITRKKVLAYKTVNNKIERRK